MDRLTGTEKRISYALQNPLSIYDALEEYEDLMERNRLVELPRIQEYSGNAAMDINPKYVVVYIVLGDIIISNPMSREDAEAKLKQIIKINS